MLYYDLIDAHLGAAARKALAMIPEGYQFQSEFGNRRFSEGRSEGKAELLQRQLQVKFGALPEPVIERLRAASEAELALWAERVLVAASLDEVFQRELPRS